MIISKITKFIKKNWQHLDNKVMNKTRKQSQKYQNILTKLKIDYLTIFLLQQAILWSIANKITNMQKFQNLKVAPRVAGPTFPTQSLSNLLDKILKVLILYIKSYIRHNIDLLSVALE